MFVSAIKFSAEIRFGGKLWVFLLRNDLSCKAEQRGGTGKPQLCCFFPRRANEHNQL